MTNDKDDGELQQERTEKELRATWAFLGTGVVFLGVSALAFSDIAEPPAVKVLPAVLSFGLFAFIAGMFVGVLWSVLIDDALEREAMLDD